MARARIVGSHAERPLAGAWSVASTPPGRMASVAGLESAGLDWVACDGPMTAAAALRAAGRWTLESSRDFDADDWWYRCRLAPGQLQAGDVLRFDGLATIADVWLDDDRVLHSENMFTRQRVSVANPAADATTLTICFRALSPLLAVKRARPAWRTRLVAQQSLRFYRTSLLGRMPGWCPPIAPVGPWRPVVVESGGFHIEHADLSARIDGDDGVVDVAVRVSGGGLDGDVTVLAGESSATARVRRVSSATEITATVVVPKAQRWWPHTHGAPRLYPVQMHLVVDGRTQTVDFGGVGFRTLEVDRGDAGDRFGLIVNGVPVFCRGVCWSPLDIVSLSGTAAEYRAALTTLRDGGTNMLRVPGTMAYESEVFHDLCDELGILVWQDLMFASMAYPWDDAAFTVEAEREAADVLGSLQGRPSLAVVCGNSEVEQQAAMLGLPAARRLSQPGEPLRAATMAAVPGVAWLPSTPGGGTFPFHVSTGVAHYYGVGAYRRPLDDARRADVKFAAECLAFSNVPEPPLLAREFGAAEAPGHHPRWKARVPRDNGAGWDFEDVRDHYVGVLFGVDAASLRAVDPDRYLTLGRIATGEAMQRTFAEWRRPESACRGGLVWLARDFWPGAGCGILDSTGAPKAAYWYLRRALAPLALLAADEGLNGLWLHVVNDTDEPFEGDLRVSLYKHGVRRGVPAHCPIAIAPHASRSVHADALFDGFLDLTHAYRFGPPGHDVISATLRCARTGDLRAHSCYFPGTVTGDAAAPLGLSARVERTSTGYDAILASDRFAYGVALDVDGFIPDDNYVAIEPGEPRRVTLRPLRGMGAVRGCVTALNGECTVPLVLDEAISVP